MDESPGATDWVIAGGCRRFLGIDWPRCGTNALRGLDRDFYVFTGILFSVGPPGAISFAVRFYLPRSATDGLRRQYLVFYVFTCRAAYPTPFGDIFFVLAFLLAALLDRRPPGAISFAVRFYLPRF